MNAWLQAICSVSETRLTAFASMKVPSGKSSEPSRGEVPETRNDAIGSSPQRSHKCANAMNAKRSHLGSRMSEVGNSDRRVEHTRTRESDRKLSLLGLPRQDTMR